MVYLIILLIIGTIIGACGQLLIKKGLSQIGEINTPTIKTIVSEIFKVLSNKLIFAGLCCSVLAAFFWFFVLSRAKLSIVYPIGNGLLYILIIILSLAFLEEKINYIQLSGILITLVGIVILAIS